MQPLDTKVHKAAQIQVGMERLFFNFYIILFPICQKYMPNFFLRKCHPAASSTGGMKVPPDEPAAGALQKAYRRLIRRKGYCSDPRGHCSDLLPIQTAVL